MVIVLVSRLLHRLPGSHDTPRDCTVLAALAVAARSSVREVAMAQRNAGHYAAVEAQRAVQVQRIVAEAVEVSAA